MPVCVQAVADMPGPQRTLWIQNLFLFALVWSVGGNTDAPGRERFNAYLRRLVANDVPSELALFATGEPVRINQMFPESKSVYDFMFDKGKSSWQFWLATIEAKPIDVDAEYSNIVVPTVDTVRCLLHWPHALAPMAFTEVPVGWQRMGCSPYSADTHPTQDARLFDNFAS